MFEQIFLVNLEPKLLGNVLYYVYTDCIRLQIILGVNLMKNRKTLWSLILMFLLVLLSSFFSTTAYAVPSTNEVYEQAPNGMKLDGYIDIPAGYSNTATNQANVVSNSSKLITGYPAELVQILSANHSGTTQLSSFWGKIKSDGEGNKTYNYFDLSKKQEISAWIYNGDSTTDTTDGFAFVLQNDSNGIDAISRYQGLPRAGQTLGVWGAASANNGEVLTDVSGTSGNAIQNSFAIEFDSFLNKDTPSKKGDQANSFDAKNKTSTQLGDLKFAHIAWQYPALQSSYELKKFSYLLREYYYQELKHVNAFEQPFMLGYDDEDITNPAAAWRHFSVEYTPPADGKSATLYYKFNDKYPDGTSKLPGAVDGNKINLNIDNFNSTDNKIRWGFTAANGSSGTVNKDVAIIMEKMPAIVDIDINSVLYDLTKDTKSTDMSSTTNDSGVTTYAPLPTNDGDRLKLKYSLKYVDGVDSSGEISAKMALPEHVDYKADADGNIGVITYHDADGKVVKEEQIKQTQLELMTTTIPGEKPTYKDIMGLNLKLDALKDADSYVTIEVYGNAQAIASDTLKTTSVSSEHTAYKSDNYNGDVMSPAFTIDNEKLQIKNTNSLNQTLTVDDNLKLAGTTNYLRGSTFDGQNVQATIKVFDADGNAIGEEGKADLAIATGTTTGTFAIDYPLADFEGGKTYTFEINLKDSKSRVSNTLTYTVQIKDVKALQITKVNYLKDAVLEKDNPDKLQIKSEYSDSSVIGQTDLTTYYQVDDQDPISLKSNASNTDKAVLIDFDLTELNMDIGSHELKVYTSDGKRESNTLTYQLKVIDKGLVLTAKEPVIDVRDTDPVPLTWNVVYSSELEDKTATDKVRPRKYLLQVKNEGDTEYRDFYYQGTTDTEDKTTISQLDDDNNFTFNANPIKHADYAPEANNNQNVLKEGQNKIKFSVYEDNYHSNEVVVTINVPKLTTKLTAVKSDIYFKGTGTMVYYPFEFEYVEDDKYTTRTGMLKSTFITDTGREMAVGMYTGEDDFRSFKLQSPPVVFGLNWKDTPDHVFEAYTVDPYDRKSNTVSFTMHMIDKYLELHVDPNEEFNDVAFDTEVDSLVGRKSDWGVTVENVGAKWNLYAQSSGLYHEQNSDYRKGLAFVDKNDNILNLSEQRMIASRTTKLGNGPTRLENIASDWDDDEGILLQNNKPDMAGKYQGTINWTLEDVID